MTAAEIVNRVHERFDKSKILSIYGQTVEFSWCKSAFRIWTNVADELEVRSIDPTFNYQFGEITEKSEHVRNTME